MNFKQVSTQTTTSIKFGSYLLAFVFGVIFLLAGALLKRSHVSKNEVCSYMTEGQIIDLVIHKTVESNGSTSSTYYPAYHYSYGGNDYDIVSQQAAKDAWEFKKGQEVTVMLDPAHPDCSYLKEQEKSSATAYKFFLGVGTGLMAVSIIAYIFNYFFS